VSDFGWGGLVVIVCAVEVGYWRIDQFIDINVVEAIDPNSVELAAERGILSPRKGADPAVFAEDMVNAVGLIVDKVSFA
jgi:hypothetical protein